MFDVAPSELLLVAVVALLVIGPNDLPKALRTAGKWLGRVRRMSNHFRAGVETMIREAELAEIEKEWRERNERIMAEHPSAEALDTGVNDGASEIAMEPIEKAAVRSEEPETGSPADGENTAIDPASEPELPLPETGTNRA